MTKVKRSAARKRMLSEERRRRLLEWIRTDGNVSTGALLEGLDISPMTLWRDLAWLEKKGLIVRTRGGALAPDFRIDEPAESEAAEPAPATSRASAPSADEMAVLGSAAQYAARRLIAPQSAILLDDGTLTRAMIPYIQASHVRVVAMSLPLLNALAERVPHLQPVCPGGILSRADLVFHGPMVDAFLSDFPVDVAFLSLDSLVRPGANPRSVQTQSAAKARLIEKAGQVYGFLGEPYDPAQPLADGFPWDRLDGVLLPVTATRAQRDALSRKGLTVLVPGG